MSVFLFSHERPLSSNCIGEKNIILSESIIQRECNSRGSHKKWYIPSAEAIKIRNIIAKSVKFHAPWCKHCCSPWMRTLMRGRVSQTKIESRGWVTSQAHLACLQIYKSCCVWRWCVYDCAVRYVKKNFISRWTEYDFVYGLISCILNS